MTAAHPSPPHTAASATPLAPPIAGPAQALDAATQRRLINDQLFQSVLDATPRTLVIALLSALTLATAATWAAPAGPSGGQHRRLAWAWFALMALVLLHGLHTSLVRRRRAGSHAAGQLVVVHFTWGSHACAVLWGAASWVLLPAPSPWANLVILVGLSLVLSGAAAAMAGYRPVVTIHVGLIAAVSAAGLFRTLEPAYIACGIGLLLLGAVAISGAHRQEAALRSAIAGQLRISSLLEQLRGEQMQSETARREAEAAHEEAERAHAAKTVFMAAASHDLRQPMHALAQYVAAIARLNADPKLSASIEGANHAIDAMGDLLMAVLEISKLMAGAVTPNPDVFSLDDWSARHVSQLRPLAAAKGLGLDVHIQQQLLVRTDRVLLDRMVRKLLHNALTYTQQGQVLLRVTRRGDCVRIRVADTGMGIALADQARVFEPFYQVANPGRDREHGFGLGLAIVRELAQLLGLRLRLTSRLGRGSCFTITLPISPDRRRFARPPSPALDTRAVNQVADAFIVLIDDDDLSLRATEATLVAFGCQVVAGHSADEVLVALSGVSVCPQLIVSDYRLKGATGLDAVAQLQRHFSSAFGPDARPPAVIVSGETSPDELAKVHAAGAEMLHKPVRPAVLFKHLNAALHRRAAGPAPVPDP